MLTTYFLICHVNQSIVLILSSLLFDGLQETRKRLVGPPVRTIAGNVGVKKFTAR